MKQDYELFCKMVGNTDDENLHTDYEKCEDCKGRCCKEYPCELLPDDILYIAGKIDYDIIMELLSTNLVAIDSYFLADCDMDMYFLRMKTIGESVRGDLVYEGYGGVCCALGKNGCKLKFENRPFTGRFGFPCDHTKNLYPYDISKKNIATMWEPYSEILEKIVEEQGITGHVEDNGKTVIENYFADNGESGSLSSIHKRSPLLEALMKNMKQNNPDY